MTHEPYGVILLYPLRGLLSCSETIPNITGAKSMVLECGQEDYSCLGVVFVGLGSNVRETGGVGKGAEICSL